MSEVEMMLGNGEAQKEAIRPDFNKSIFIDFAGAKITSDAEVLERYNGIFGFSNIKFYLEQRKVGQKLANGHAAQLFGESDA